MLKGLRTPEQIQLDLMRTYNAGGRGRGRATRAGRPRFPFFIACLR